jgi:hypothetical protein
MPNNSETLETPESSNIQEATYVSEGRLLTILFRNGGLYQYADVPTEVWEGFKAASSRGSYLAKCIKGRFQYTYLVGFRDE